MIIPFESTKKIDNTPIFKEKKPSPNKYDMCKTQRNLTKIEII